MPKQIIYELVATMNVYLNAKKLSSSFSSALYFCDPLLYSTIGILGVAQSTHLTKLDHIIDLIDLYPYAKKGLHNLSL